MQFLPEAGAPGPDPAQSAMCTAVSPRGVYHSNVKPLLSTNSEHCPDQHQDAVCQVKTGTAIDSKGLQEVAETSHYPSCSADITRFLKRYYLLVLYNYVRHMEVTKLSPTLLFPF